MGGLSWFSVPFAFGTTMGLSARALQASPVFPTYPQPLSADQQGAGLVAPAAAVALLGREGAIAMLIITYMAVTSACSAQLISVSSIFTYDVYRVSSWLSLAGGCGAQGAFDRHIGGPELVRRSSCGLHTLVSLCGVSGSRYGASSSMRETLT